MTRDVDSPIALPRHWAASGSPIAAATSVQAGVADVARTLNTLYEQHRCTVVCDDYRPGICGLGDTARYRIPTMGRGGLTEEVTCYYRLSAPAGAGGGGTSCTVTFSSVNAGDSENRIHLSGSAISEQWFAVTNRLTVADDQDYEDINVAFTGTYTSALVHSIALVYYRARTALDAPPAGGITYAGNGFMPVDLSIVADNHPLSPALVYTLHGNARDLYARTGPAITSAFPSAPLQGSTGNNQRTILRVPRDVETLTYSVYCSTAGVRVKVSTQRESKMISCGTTGWHEATFDVRDMTDVDILAQRFNASGYINAVSARWGDRQLR